VSSLSLLFVAFHVSSCGARSEEAVAKLSDEEPAVLVRLGGFSTKDVSRRLSVAADLEAVNEADVVSQLPGVVARVLKQQGDPVQRDEPVIRLVDDELQLEVDNHRIVAEQAELKVRQADLARKEGRKKLKQQQLNLEQLQKEYERALKSADIVSPESLDSKRYSVGQAKIEVETLQLKNDTYQLAYLQAVQEAKLNKVKLATAEFRLSQTVLRSPIRGLLTYLRLKTGELVSSQDKAFSVVSLDRLEARLYVPQRELARLQVGLDVVLRSDVFPDREYRSRVRVVNPVVDEARGTVEVLVDVEDASGFFKPGLFVTGEIILETHRDALLVPKKAIRYENRQAVIFLVREERAYRYLLTVGLSTREGIEVQGLTASDGSAGTSKDGELVLVGHDRLKDGARVEIEGESSE